MNPYLSALAAVVSLAICIWAFRYSHRFLFSESRNEQLLGVFFAFIGSCGGAAFLGVGITATVPRLLPQRPLAVGGLIALGYTLTLAIGAYARKRRSHQPVRSL
ncbi:hypothetical protein DVK07_10740 [Halorubrum sp. Atlit-26R]|jgi:hypothetical protein|nr:hypothetical protein DVK07_10740 [Halorubrum sp. Atlit-26R]